MLIISHWLRAFAWTMFFEQLVAGLLLRRALPAAGRRASVIALGNLASHPAVWLIFPELGAALGLPGWATLLLSEAWAFGVEAWLYWLVLGASSARLAVKVSIAANAASLACGYVLRWFGLV